MEVSYLDLLHHRMLLGDENARELFKKELEKGVKEKCPVVQEFIERVKGNKNNSTTLKKQSFIQIHRNKIISFAETPYKLTKYFMFCSVALFFLVRYFYA